MDLFFRSVELDISKRDGADACTVSAVLSTDAPVEMGSVQEILEHSAQAIDLSRFPLALVENHSNAGTPLALVENPRIEDGKLRADVRFGAQTRAKEILADVLGGIIRSLSVGYRRLNSVRVSDSVIRTTSWLPMHVSPVAGPADLGAGFLRSANESTIKPEVPMSDQTPEDAQRAATEAARAEAKEIATLARSHNLAADDFVGLPLADANAAILRAITARKTAEMPAPEQPVVARAVLKVDELDKQRSAITDGICHRAGFVGDKVGVKDNPYAGRSMLDQVRLFAMRSGIRSAAEWSRKDLAHFALGEMSQLSDQAQRDSANITTGIFPNFVMLNAIKKSIAMGFEMGAATSRYKRIVSTQTVPDFKPFYIGGLGTGNLQETAENTAFPELAKSEGVYNNQAKMWGGTLSLSLQAMINDDTSSFDRSLRQAGPIADKTIDRRVFQKLLMGTSASTGTSTWTNNTTNGCTIVYTTADTAAAARANIGKPRVALQTKVGLDGNPLGISPRFLVCGPTNEQYARGLLAPVGGQVVGNGYGDTLEVVATPWLEASALTGYSTTTYYELADPNEVTGLVLSMIAGYEGIQVQEYDAGAIGARKWKLWTPFEADLFNVTNPSGTVIIPAAQQATT